MRSKISILTIVHTDSYNFGPDEAQAINNDVEKLLTDYMNQRLYSMDQTLKCETVIWEQKEVSKSV